MMNNQLSLRRQRLHRRFPFLKDTATFICRDAQKTILRIASSISLESTLEMMDDKVKIVIADDHPIVRQGLRQMIEADRNLTVVGEASDGETALQLIETHQPDVAVLDIDMPRIGGFDVVRELERKKIRVKIIFLTMHTEEEVFQTAIDLGVGGYVLKDSATNDIVAGIKSIAAGKPFISPAMSALLLNRRRRAQKLESEKPELDLLTPTERRILKLIAEDKEPEIGTGFLSTARSRAPGQYLQKSFERQSGARKSQSLIINSNNCCQPVNIELSE